VPGGLFVSRPEQRSDRAHAPIQNDGRRLGTSSLLGTEPTQHGSRWDQQSPVHGTAAASGTVGQIDNSCERRGTVGSDDRRDGVSSTRWPSYVGHRGQSQPGVTSANTDTNSATESDADTD